MDALVSELVKLKPRCRIDIDALATVCTQNTNVVMVGQRCSGLGTQTLSWFGHSCSVLVIEFVETNVSLK